MCILEEAQRVRVRDHEGGHLLVHEAPVHTAAGSNDAPDPT